MKRYFDPNNSFDLNNYNIGQHYLFSLQTITDFIWFLKLQIVSSCRGFPLALKVNGISLHGKPVEGWRSRARKWSNGHFIFNSCSDLLDCLRRSLEFSDDEVILKECFMDLGSFPEDQRITVPALIDMWAELYDLDEYGIDAIANLHELTTRNLANLVRTRYDDSFFLWCDILVACFLSSCNHC